jgi:hypothetical protein
VRELNRIRSGTSYFTGLVALAFFSLYIRFTSFYSLSQAVGSERSVWWYSEQTFIRYSSIESFLVLGMAEKVSGRGVG